MEEGIPLVGLDACVLIEAVLFAGTDYPSARILAAAGRGAFRLALVAAVEREARRALRAAGREAELDSLLEGCLVFPVPDASEEQLLQDKRLVWAVIRDEPDAEIGVALHHARPTPQFFVSSNRADWRPGEETRRALNGCRVVGSVRFARLISLRP